MGRPRRLSDAVTAANAPSIARALVKYGYLGPGRPDEVARWLRARGTDIDTALATAREVRREARPEQAAFRRALIEAYAGRCALSGCDVEAALEAAHVADWREENDAGAGVLLRADLHRLHERGLLAIDASFTVVEAPRWYAGLVGRRLRLPANWLDWPRLGREGAAGSK